MRRQLSLPQMLYHIVCVALALFVAVGCENLNETVDELLGETVDELLNNEDISITTESSKLTFGASDNLTQTIEIEASHEWCLLNADNDALYAYADWVSEVTPTTAALNSEVTITLEENQSVNKRTTSLYFGIKKSDESYELLQVEIEQQPNESTMSLDRYVFWFMEDSAKKEDLTQELTISTDDKWSISTEGEMPEWLSLSAIEGEGDSTISISVAVPTEPSEAYDRSVDLFVTNKDIEGFEPRTVTVSQFTLNTHHISSPDLIEGVINVKQDGTVEERCSPFTLITSHPWHFHAVDGTDQDGYPAWAVPSPLSGIANDTVRLVCAPNNTREKREALFCIGLETTTVGVHYYKNIRMVQEGVVGSITFAPANMEFTSASAESPVAVASSESWYISGESPYLKADDKWLTVSKAVDAEGANGESVTLKVAKNPLYESRSTEIYFMLKGYPEMDPIVYTVTQEAAKLSDATFTVNGSENLSFLVSDGSKNIAVTSEFPWRIISSAENPSDDKNFDHKAWVKATKSADNNSINIAVTKNQFYNPRTTSVYLIQEQSNKKIEIVINQVADTNSWLADYGALGCGYNSAGEYGYQTEVRGAVLDCDRLERADLLADVNYSTGSTIKKETFSSIEDVQSSLATNANISGGYNGFSASVESNYGLDTSEYSETEYGSCKVNYERLRVYTKTVSYAEDQIASLLRPCLTDAASSDINNPSVSAETIVANYGTHVVLGYIKGGVHEYSISVIRTAEQKATNFDVAVQAGYETVAGGVSGGAGVAVSSALKKEAHTANETYKIRGGGAYSDAASWAKYLDKDNIVLTDFCESGLFPIWLLATDPARQNAIKSAAMNTSKSLGVASKKRGVYQFEFWIGRISTTDNDGGDTAEMRLSLQSKMCNAGANQITAAKWLDKWRPWDNTIDILDTGIYNYFPVGTENVEGNTNRVRTEQWFTAGAAQHEISFKIELAEDDTGNSMSDYIATYQFFRTKDNYATNGGDPFWYNYSEQEIATPVLQSGGARPTWWSDTPQAAEGGGNYNGYVDCTVGKWSWILYYRVLSPQEMN